MKKQTYIQLFILALLFSIYSFLPHQVHAQTVHEWKGGEEIIPVGAAPPGPIEFENRSNTHFYDFTIVLESQNGLPLPFSIDTVTVDGKTYNETHNTGSFVRIEADTNANGTYKDSERIPKKSSVNRKIQVTLTSHPTVPYNIRIQPTSATASAVMVSANGNFGPCGTYMTTFSDEGVIANTYEGMMFNDVNTTGLPITELHLQPMGPPWFIMDAIPLDGVGLPMPGGFYSPSGGTVSFPQPILPGEPFGVQIIPNALIPNQPMMLQACLGLPPFDEPFFQISGIDLLDVGAPFHSGITTKGELRFQYETPLTHALKYLNILYQPTHFGDTSIYWIGQNIALEHFTDTMEMTLPFDMLPGATGIPLSAPPLCDLAIFITDSIYTGIGNFGPTFFSPYSFTTREVSFGPNMISPEELSRPLPSGVTLPPIRWERENSRGVLIGCNMVNHDLDSTQYRGGQGGPYVPNDYAGDWNACGPVATTNSFSWLRTIHPDIEQKLGAAFGQGDSAQRKMLAEFSEMMERANEQGVHMFDFIEAKLEFIDKYKLPMRVTYQSVFSDSTIESPNDCYGHTAENSSVNPPNPAPYGKISPEWIYDRVDENCDTELFVMWRNDTLNLTTGDRDTVYGGGHYITVTGVRENNGNWRLRWKDDEHQERAGGLRHGISDMRVGPEGVIWIPGLDDGDWECFIKDAIVECYDSTVTFNAIKGRAFEDGNGNGTQEPGEGGVEGATVRLVDSNGDVVEETTTDENGEYVFQNPPSGDYHVEFDNLPPGYDFSPQNVGANDSIDSDVDANGHTGTITLNNNPEGNTDAGLVPNRISRLAPQLWLPTLIDPATQEMVPQLDNQGYLPETEPFTAMGMTLMAFTKDSLYRENFTQSIVDWIVVELRDGNDSTVIIGAIPGVLLTDGRILGADGKPLIFYGVPHGNYFIVIRPRNGLALMSDFSIALDNQATSIDFSSPSLPIYGTDTRTSLPGGKMALTLGDANADGIINAADRSGVWNFRNAVGYLPWDINLDGVCNAADRSEVWNKRNMQQQLP